MHASYLLIVLILFIYVILRAINISFSHDESLTFTIFEGNRKWLKTANNHWLNTILAYISSRIFGYSELSLRLPNIISFPIFSYYCFKLFVFPGKYTDCIFDAKSLLCRVF